jgi:hypothetical protein
MVICYRDEMKMKPIILDIEDWKGPEYGPGNGYGAGNGFSGFGNGNGNGNGRGYGQGGFGMIK